MLRIGQVSARLLIPTSAPVAQLDRASDFESAGRPFESGRVRHCPLICNTTYRFDGSHPFCGFLQLQRYRFFLPKKVLQKVFRAELIEALEDAFAKGKIHFHGKLKHLSDRKAFRAFVRGLFRCEWAVHCSWPPRSQHYSSSVPVSLLFPSTIAFLTFRCRR
jgi:hypothetical protein